MLTISGKLLSKSILKSGEGEYGQWKVIQFVIAKTHAKKKIKIAITAKGKYADFINDTPKNEKLKIEFFPYCFYSEKNTKYYTELRAVSIERWMPKKRFNLEFNKDVLNPVLLGIKKDLQLDFNDEKK
jgi:hypothetical protein